MLRLSRELGGPDFSKWHVPWLVQPSLLVSAYSVGHKLAPSALKQDAQMWSLAKSALHDRTSSSITYLDSAGFFQGVKPSARNQT